MAGAGYKLFNTGDVLTAQQVNEYLQQQVTMVFANATARTSALSGVLAEGMMSYLQDTNLVEVYDGSNWVSVGNTGDITGVTAGTGISGGGTSGTVTITNSMATAIDAKGDLIVGTGADTFDRLAVGTNGHTLVADSSTATGLKWASSSPTASACRVYNNASTSVNNATTTALPFDSEHIDTDGYHSNTTNNTRLTIPTGLGGIFMVGGNVYVSPSSAFTIQLRIRVNGTGSPRIYVQEQSFGASEGKNLQIRGILNLVAGDYVEFEVYQASGGAVTFQTNGGTTFYGFFEIVRLGA